MHEEAAAASETGEAISSLSQYLTEKMLGSTLQINQISPKELNLEAGDILTLKTKLDDTTKEISFELFSAMWNRRLTVEEFNGIKFLETKAEADLEKEHLEGIAEDALLALDLIKLWVEENGYEFEEAARPGLVSQIQSTEEAERS